MVAEISDQHSSEWPAIGEVARLLGVSNAETVRKWMARPRSMLVRGEESAELTRLKRENAELRRANAI